MTSTRDPLLLNEVLPHYDISSLYKIRVHASPQRIFQVLQNGFPIGGMTRFLMALRGIPRYFRRTDEHVPAENAFYKLKQLENREIVVGIIGQFWRPVANPVPIHSLQEFLDFRKDGYCKAAMNLCIFPGTVAGECVVTTETRVIGYGGAKSQFRDYWRIIAPFSGLIRREILKKIKQRAEK